MDAGASAEDVDASAEDVERQAALEDICTGTAFVIAFIFSRNLLPIAEVG